jgi:hypothetical protein
VALYLSDTGAAIFDGVSESRVILASYEPKSLANTIPQVINEARKEMEVRFNFYLPAELNYYLETVTRERNTSKAEFLRELINKHRESQDQV